MRGGTRPKRAKQAVHCDIYVAAGMFSGDARQQTRDARAALQDCVHAAQGVHTHTVLRHVHASKPGLAFLRVDACACAGLLGHCTVVQAGSTQAHMEQLEALLSACTFSALPLKEDAGYDVLCVPIMTECGGRAACRADELVALQSTAGISSHLF